MKDIFKIKRVWKMIFSLVLGSLVLMFGVFQIKINKQNKKEIKQVETLIKKTDILLEELSDKVNKNRQLQKQSSKKEVVGPEFTTKMGIDILYGKNIQNELEWNIYVSSQNWNEDFKQKAKKAFDWTDSQNIKVLPLAFSFTEIPKDFCFPNRNIQIKSKAFYFSVFDKNFVLPKNIIKIDELAFEKAFINEGFLISEEITNISDKAFLNHYLASYTFWYNSKNIKQLANMQKEGEKLQDIIPKEGWFVSR